MDDTPSIVKMMLGRLGHQMSVADNDAMAVTMICNRWVEKQESYDMILMDLQMPVMDGLEATRRIRMLEQSVELLLEKSGKVQVVDTESLSPLPPQFIVCMSANDDEDTKQDSQQAGMNAFLCKPFKIDTFHQLCETHHLI